MSAAARAFYDFTQQQIYTKENTDEHSNDDPRGKRDGQISIPSQPRPNTNPTNPDSKETPPF